MESFKVENLSFTYPTKSKKALDNISFDVRQGEFILLCGKSGCGKTTLLRLLKPILSPSGKISGSIYFNGKAVSECDIKEQASGIGFVMQSPDNQLVTDKVWHELAFGMESLGYKQNEIRTRVAEMASFFGIQTWFHKKVTELSGGQKQLLNLASVMVMQPTVLILDEPTSQLDPIAAGEFLKTLEKINRELGRTVILTEHRIEEAFSVADRVIVMDEGKIIADAPPKEIGTILGSVKNDMHKALPTAVRVHMAVKSSLPCPLSVRDGRKWLEEFSKDNELNFTPNLNASHTDTNEPLIEIKDVWFRYGKDLPDIIKGLNLKINRGETFCIVGGNGSGKTTALSLISGLNAPYRGEVLINGKNVLKTKGLYNGLISVLPQNPQSVFVKKTVYLDLKEILSERKLTNSEQERRITAIAQRCRIDRLLDSHPYDLSGGEQQRAALAKILLSEPQILILDEPTKGMDVHFKEEFAEILQELNAEGVTVIMVSHDIEFCAQYAHRCALFFDGSITAADRAREFFKGNNFYTTSANRMARTMLPDAVLTEDIILACGGSVEKRERKTKTVSNSVNETEIKPGSGKEKKLSPGRIIGGIIFTLLFILTEFVFFAKSFISEAVNELAEEKGIFQILLQIVSLAEMAGALLFFFPQKEIGVQIKQTPTSNGRLKKRTLCSEFMILLLIPLTIYTGVFFLGDRKYYFISLLIILETMLPFAMVFESRKPKARELIVISVLCALAVAGRGAFFMLPQFKPVVAIVIITGVCFGGETGFLVGALTGFVSNFFFGQGPWTPWQMFAFGLIGFIAGVLFKKGFLRLTKVSLGCFGFLSAFIIYGGIMNPASIIMWQSKITWEMLVSAWVAGIPFDLIHALSTLFFIWFTAAPMIEKLERVKLKYNLNSSVGIELESVEDPQYDN